MVDTNILVSIAVFRSGKLGGMLDDICLHHTLCLSTYIIDEFLEVVRRKFPDKLPQCERFLEKLPFVLEYTPHELPAHDWFEIRDEDDEGVLYSAITADVDILISGDGDFSPVEIERPDILTPREFLERY
jgi:putative PIN family toxin of toxin-antitoxin system